MVLIILLGPKYLDGWYTSGQCLLGHSTMPLISHRLTKTPHELTPPNSHHRGRKNLSGGTHDSQFASFGRAILPWPGVNVNENMIRNLSLILEDIVESDAKTIATQKRSLDISDQGSS